MGGLLDDFVEETASPLMRTVVERHLADCEGCRRTVRERQCVRRLLRQLPQPGMPAGMKHRLLSAFRSLATPPPSAPAPTVQNVPPFRTTPVRTLDPEGTPRQTAR